MITSSITVVGTRERNMKMQIFASADTRSSWKWWWTLRRKWSLIKSKWKKKKGIPALKKNEKRKNVVSYYSIDVDEPFSGADYIEKKKKNRKRQQRLYVLGENFLLFFLIYTDVKKKEKKAPLSFSFLAIKNLYFDLLFIFFFFSVRSSTLSCGKKHRFYFYFFRRVANKFTLITAAIFYLLRKTSAILFPLCS